MSQDISRRKRVTKTLVAFGSNVSVDNQPPVDVLRTAIQALASDSVKVSAVSRRFSTPCVPAGAGPDYVNSVASFHVALSADAFLSHLHQIENQFRRERAERWGARTLDLDLLDFGGAVMPDREGWGYWHDLPEDRQRREAPERLILPHPRLQDRAFVLVPLMDIAPDWRHPVLGRTVTEMYTELTEEQLSGIRPVDPPIDPPLAPNDSLALPPKGL